MKREAPAFWDFAGVDGLALARALFGTEVSHLAAFQSLQTECGGAACSLLRLCENNFRVRADGKPAQLADTLCEAASGRQVWVKPSALASLLLEEEEWRLLRGAASVKPPHRLTELPVSRAVPARIAGCAVLVWHHPINGINTLEVQTAPDDLGKVSAALKV